MKEGKKSKIKINWQELSNLAWIVRERASVLGNTKVGAALVTESDNYYVGCNVEHRYRNHDVHAEVNAVTNMVTAGETKFKAIMVVAERTRFTPCGSCLDWIFQFGDEDCLIGTQSSRDGELKVYTAKEMMPFYPY